MKIGLIFASHYFNYATMNKNYKSWGKVMEIHTKSPIYLHILVYWMK